jgi:hypothetical protein
VLDVFGEELVDGVGLVAGEDGEAAGVAVGACELLHDADEAGVEGEAVGVCGFATLADDAAAVGGEGDAV